MGERFTWTCRCGEVEATFPVAKSLTLGCYCTFCRHFMTDFGAADALDAAGGATLSHVTPDQISMTRGQENLGLVNYTTKGVHRWHTTCCDTPFANTPKSPKAPYVAITAAWATPAEAIRPPGIVANSKSATAAPLMKSTSPVATGLALTTRTLGARMSGRYRTTPFFDTDGQPVAQPQRRPRPTR